jgi:DNA-binding CsgD family transcriptional regulator
MRRGITPEVAENTQGFLDLLAPIFDAEDFKEDYSIPLLAELFLEDLQEGIPALAGGVPDHLDALLQPRSLVWSLWEALNTRLPSRVREAALTEIRKKIRTPLYWKRWKDLKGRIVPRLQEDHPELSTRAALELRTMQALYHASEKVLSLLPDEPMDPKGVLRRLKSTMGEEIPEEILGPGWKEEEGTPAADVAEEEAQPALDVLELHPLAGADVDRLFDVLADRGGLTPMEREVFLTVWKEQATDKEAAGILGISEGAVRLRLHKARKKIKEVLGGI